MNHPITNDSDARKFAVWVDENHPTEVNLSSSSVTDQTLKLVATSLRRNHKLQRVTLDNNSITGTGCSIVADILRNNAHISSVTLLHNPICSNAQLYDNQASIREFVETCNEMQNIRSVCGCSSSVNEVSLASSDDTEQSNVLLLGIDLRLDTDLLSLRYGGSAGLSEVFESLRDNRSLVRGAFCDLRASSEEFDLALITFLEQNMAIKTLQFSFSADNKSTEAAELGSEKGIMLCIARSMEKNLGVTCLQLDSWPRDRETVTGIVSMLRKNTTLLHVALFNTPLRVSDLEAMAGALEYNTTLRVLHINDASCEHKGSSVAKHLLTAEVVQAFETAAKKRKSPFIIRTESKDFLFGAARQMAVPPAVQWEVEDRVEFQSEEDIWVPATVIAVYPDQRYSVRLDSPITVRLHCRSQDLRAGARFSRCTSIPGVPSITHRNASETKAPPQVPPATELIKQTSSTSSVHPAPAESSAVADQHFPVVYAPEQAVEVRCLGDSVWLPGTVVHADHRYPTEIVTVRVQLALDITETTKGSVRSAGQNVEDVAEFEACFVRPALPTSAAPVRDTGTGTKALASAAPLRLTFSAAYYNHQEQNHGRAFYDAGAYQRGDYVEVRMLSSNAGDPPAFVWKRGRLATDRKNGTYDVRMETGTDIGGVRGCHLRYHFRPRDVVDYRSSEPTEAPLSRAMSRLEDGAGTAEVSEALSPDERDPDSDGRHHKHRHHHHHHKKHHHHHHRHHSRHKSHGKSDEQPVSASLEDLPPPQPCMWSAALVLKQERTGTYAISHEDGTKEKGISATRLMPANRSAVRTASEGMRVVSQSWEVQDTDDADADHADENMGDGVNELPSESMKGLRGSISLAEPLNVAAFVPLEEDAISTSESNTPSTAHSISLALTQRGSDSPAVVLRSMQPAAEVQSPLKAQASPKESVKSPWVASVPATPRNSTVAALMSAPPTPRPLISVYDINDRIEVSQGFIDGESIWVAGRVEAIHPDNCTYFIRYVDGGTDKAVSSKRMRRASLATPMRNGARFVDKALSTTTLVTPAAGAPPPTVTVVPVPTKDLSAAVTSVDQESSEDEPVPPVKHAPKSPVAFTFLEPSATTQEVVETHHTPSAHEQVDDSPHKHHKHHHHHHHSHSRAKSESALVYRSISPVKETRAPEEPVVTSPRTKEQPVPAATPMVHVSMDTDLLPPLRSPERRYPTNADAAVHKAPEPVFTVTEGMWLSIFNASTKSYEPCMVECVYEGGVFDACNKRGELYRRIDQRYVDPKSVELTRSSAVSAAPAPLSAHPVILHFSAGGENHADKTNHQVRTAKHDVRAAVHDHDDLAAHDGHHSSLSSQREAVNRTPQAVAPMHSEPQAAAHQPRSNHKRTASKATNKHQKAVTFKVGAKVDACVDSHDDDGHSTWVHAIIVKKLSPEIYTVFLEDANEELTLVATMIRHRSAHVDHSFDGNRSFSAHHREINCSRQEERPEVSSSEENRQHHTTPKQHSNLSSFLTATHQLHNDGGGLGVSMRDAMDPSDYGYADLAAEGSLDGSLDDDELVVVGTQYGSSVAPVMPLAMLDSNGSLTALDSDPRFAADDGYEAVVDNPYQVVAPRRPVTAPVRHSQSHAHRTAERSSSASRHHDHHQQRRRVSGVPAGANREHESEHSGTIATPLKPVSIGAGISPSVGSVVPVSLQFPVHHSPTQAAGEVEPAVNLQNIHHTHGPSSLTAYAESPHPDGMHAGVCHRSHAAPLNWCPVIAFIEMPSAMLHQDASSLSDVSVVATSEFAAFQDARGGRSSCISWPCGATSSTQAVHSSAVLSMCVSENAPDICPAKVVFYIQAVIIAEVHFQVSTTVATLRSSAVKARTPGEFGASQELSRIRQYAVEAQASWCCAKVGVYQHIRVLNCGMSGRRMIKHVLTESISAVPSFIDVHVHEVSELSDATVLDAVLHADKVQLVCDSDAHAPLNRETWLALLHSSAELAGVVKSLCAVHGSSPPDQYRLAISTVGAHAGVILGSADNSHSDWLYSVGLSPVLLDEASTATGHPLAALQWVHSDSKQEDAAPRHVALRSRFVRTHRALCQALMDFQHHNTDDVPLGVLLLPPQAEFVVTSFPAARSGSAGQRHKKGKAQSHDRDQAWHLVFLCDTLGTPNKGAGMVPMVSIPVTLTAQLVFDLAPLLKTSIALAIAHIAAIGSGAPTSSSPFAVHAAAEYLQIDQLTELFALYSELEESFLSCRFSSAAIDHPALNYSLASFALQTMYRNAQADSVNLLECAVTHLEQSLLPVYQHDLSHCVAALKALTRQIYDAKHATPSASQILSLQVDGVVHWIAPTDVHESWRTLVELSRPSQEPAQTLHRLNIRTRHLDFLDLITATKGPAVHQTGLDGALGQFDPSSAASAFHASQGPGSPSVAKRELQSQLAQVMLHEVGVKDAFSAQEAAGCLVAMGCSSYIDFVSIGTVFAMADGRIEVEKLRVFLHEGGIPLFIAAKLAVFIQNKLSH